MVLTSARRFANLCLPEERGSGEEEEEGRGEGEREKGPRTHFVEMLAEVLLAMSRDPQQFTKFQMPPGNCDPNADSPESLTSILGMEFLVPYDRTFVVNLYASSVYEDIVNGRTSIDKFSLR